MNPFDLFKNLQGLQAKMQEMQGKVEAIEVEGSSSAGMVKATMDGSFRLISIEINPSLLTTPDDMQLVAELCKLAVNDAWDKVRAKIKGEMGGLEGMFPGMPG